MLNREDYRKGWEWKQRWYNANGFVMDDTLYTSEDDDRCGLDSAALRAKVSAIKARLG
jgi:hypothetical protein